MTGRLAALLSFRTISGKLILGLLALFGVASVIISVITAQSLNSSLMSSLDQQVQAATRTWFGCVQQAAIGSQHHDPDHRDAAGPDPDDYKMCSTSGQAPGTFEAQLHGTSVVYKTTVQRTCSLTAADRATLAALPLGSGPLPTRPADSGGPNPPSPGPTAPVRTYIRTLDSLGGKFMLTKVPGPQPGTTLITGMPLAMVDKTLERVENTEHMVFATVLLLAVLLGAALIQFSLRPLRRVAADASHELRTPLSAIRGYAELALRHPGPVPGDVTHALRRVQSESARMTVLVDDLLLLARLDAGRPLEKAPVDLSRLAIETTSDARVARDDHRWRLDLPDEPVLVQGDEHRLHQVLANLLSNAGKHTPTGSTVSVALALGTDLPVDAAADGAAAVRRGVVPPGPRVELSITDDGPGIAPELLPELFERFTRGDTGRARAAGDAGKSTGLGLAIVDAVVAAHGGCITVTSRPGMTRFAIFLPLLPDPVPQGSSRVLPVGHGQ